MGKLLNAQTLEDAMLEANEHLDPDGGWTFQFMYELRDGRFEVVQAHEDRYAITLSDGKMVAIRKSKDSYGTGANFVFIVGDKPEDWHDWQQSNPPDPLTVLLQTLKRNKRMDEDNQ